MYTIQAANSHFPASQITLSIDPGLYLARSILALINSRPRRRLF